MNQPLKPKPLPAPLRAQINRLAHLHAMHHETRLRDVYLAKVQAAVVAGLSPSELAALVEALSAPEPKG